MDFVGKIFIFLIIMLFPLYLWSYAITLSDKNSTSSRAKFYSGLFSGIFSVGATWLLSRFITNNNFLLFFVFFFCILLVAYAIIAIISRYMSPIASGFIKKISFFHILSAALTFAVFSYFSKYFFGNIFIAGIFISIFLNAFLEELFKHLSSLSLLGSRFRFSLRDLAIFGFCSVIGFTFIENFLYFYTLQTSIGTIIFRSIFSFSAHLLAVNICTFCWWKALSYKIFSFKYFLFFLIGFILAVLSHAVFNYCLSKNFLIIFLPYLVLSYGGFVYLLYEKNEHVE